MSEIPQGAAGAARPARRPGRRPAAASDAPAPPDRSLRYRHLVNPFEPLKVFSEDQVASIHEAALTVLQNQGMRVLLPEAREVYRRGGASVDESNLVVRFDRALVAESLAKAPREITMYAKDPGTAYADVGTARGVRAHLRATRTSWIPRAAAGPARSRISSNIMKLCQSYEVIHVLGGGVEPQDVPVHVRHLETMRAMMLLTDKIAEGLRARSGAERGQFRADAHRLRAHSRGVRVASLLLHGHQHELAAAARYPDGERHHGLRRRRPGAHHHARSRSRARWRP